MPPLTISPPLLNSANPWCTTLEQLRALYSTPHTGAITTRTSLLSSSGFPHNPSVNQFTFFNPSTLSSSPPNTDQPNDTASKIGSLNTLGYSPLPLSTYLSFVRTLSQESHPQPSQGTKPIIISVTGTPEEIATCYSLIRSCQDTVHMPLAMEINLSCPNIPGHPPPAYAKSELLRYLSCIKRERRKRPGGEEGAAGKDVAVGIKTPPYTYAEQFEGLIGALVEAAGGEECPVDFITAVNTLGSSLLLMPTEEEEEEQDGHDAKGGFQASIKSAAGTGVGGLAGAPLHPLALGNVFTIVDMLKRHAELAKVQVIGVGGVADTEGYRRMRGVGASAVGVGTALGRKGVGVFEEIGAKGVEDEEERKRGRGKL